MYYKLKTRDFLNDTKKNKINYSFLKKCLNKCYSICNFSTFPYFIDNLNSKESLQKYNSGNCISMSLCLKNILAELNVTSYLIPATIPTMYKRDNYLEISHVALAVPIINGVYVLDMAFYFLEPLLIRLNQNEITYIRSSNIYEDSVSLIKSSLMRTNMEIHYNQYQSIPENTFVCECRYLKNINDKWNYFLREVINPDQAISNFFINIMKYPHITTTYLKDGKQNMNIYIKIINNNEIKISEKHKMLYFGLIKNVPLKLISYLKNILGEYFNNDITYIFNFFSRMDLDNRQYFITDIN